MEKIKLLAGFLIKSIVSDRDEVKISLSSPNPNSIIVEVDALKEDIPIIIGRKGSVIRSLRSILRILSPRENKFIDIRIVEKDR
ncbi:hypothetical protein COT49_02175 [candidate division WWE3 bacterium CG08_land_8_20_14_0_20_40_13]|uniref:Uncharacterized protein n=1 Tax=candidate division WWE3 bacterium CG08_land_8_20_14_0_20_40_13 TaxID=1975084 RepID=A0A2H0XDP6_UNCKA|nr:MAG: hypothetical protein COT49_02175 [candidate division WWE3 bacterium CG08_land_8_20_14_0_20_40_13]